MTGEIHRRQSIRLKGYDYSQPGAYFFTAVTAGRASFFGEIADSEMHLNEAGQIVLAVWKDLPNHYPDLELGTFIVMPNHVHGILVFTEVGTGRSVGAGQSVGAGLRPAPTGPKLRRHGLPEIVRAFKSFSARRVNERLGRGGQALWQRNYYEHVIRDQKEWERLNQYVESNPWRREQDQEHLANIEMGHGQV